MKKKVLDGSIFHISCPYCGEQLFVDYSVLYHDMEKRALIQYSDTEEYEKTAYELFYGEHRIEAVENLFKAGYWIRFVHSQKGLSEKITILDAGLDDRVVELYKILLVHKFFKDHPEFARAKAFYVRKDGQGYIQINPQDGRPVVSKIVPELYSEIVKIFEPKLPAAWKEGPYIDQQWALDFLKKEGEKAL